MEKIDVDAGCRKVAELYRKGANCDRAVLQVLQEVLGLPPERWDFSNFYSEKPDEVDSFACKVLAAGLLGIYLDILERSALAAHSTETQANGNSERAAKVFNSLLRAISIDRTKSPADIDPFDLDATLSKVAVDDTFRNSYRQRAAKLLAAFEAEFQGRNCDEILGFDPFRYEEYDEPTQAKIEEGAWMERCVDCMRHIIRMTQT
jgi:hypothetical protein